MKVKKAEYEECKARLLKWIKPGDTVYTILRRVSRSGMQRQISVVLIRPGEKEPVILHPNYLVSRVLGRPQGKSDAIVCNGCGMDMGFDLVYHLSAVLFGDGYKLNQRWL